MLLTIFEAHLMQRFSERFNISFREGMECLDYLANCLTDERLIRVYEKVPLYETVVIYNEAKKLYIIMSMGTKKNPNEIKVSTVLYRSNEKTRILVEETDYCYVLPAEGKLRFGTEKKFFERKK